MLRVLFNTYTITRLILNIISSLIRFDLNFINYLLKASYCIKNSE